MPCAVRDSLQRTDRINRSPLTGDRQLVRALPHRCRCHNRWVQRASRAVAPAKEPSYHLMEPSPPRPTPFETQHTDWINRSPPMGITSSVVSGGSGTSQVTQPEGGNIIDLNISTTVPPSPTPAATNPNALDQPLCPRTLSPMLDRRIQRWGFATRTKEKKGEGGGDDGPLKVHLDPVWVLKDWWPIIRYLTLC
jgi:hypothetical protein